MRSENVERNQRRAAIARSLRRELGMNNFEIGKYMGLHNSSVSKLVRNGTTSSKLTNRQKVLARISYPKHSTFQV